MINILIVDDNESIRSLLSHRLSKEGFNIYQAGDGEEAYDIVCERNIDLIMLDIMMPNMNGFEFLKLIRGQDFEMPVFMITADENFDRKIEGFKLGVDDFLVKPLNMEEVALRVNSLLRRAKINKSRIITIGGVELNEETLQVTVEGEGINLAKKEFQLIFLLLSYPNKIFTRQNLLERIWEDSDTIDRTVDVHINRLREKLETVKEFKISTVKGLGYKAEILK
ncbi:MAG: response regulator transcription factor [Bacillota bacterium]